MAKSIKTLLLVMSVLGMFSACSSKTTKSPEPEPTPTPMATPAEPTAAELEAQERAKCDALDKVYYFDFDKSVVQPDAQAALTAEAECIKKFSSSVRLEGNADERGSREYNMALGERRANAVRDYLVLQGVDPTMIETVSYGEERPAVMGSNEEAWAKNRRVELIAK